MDNLQLAIFHYHMNPGGVTRIIASQIESVRRLIPSASVKLFAGHVPENLGLPSQGIEIVEDQRLNYLTEAPAEPLVMAQAIEELVVSKTTPETLLHFHNLNLGKNPLVTYAAHCLLQRGYRVINHAHDFAEDRPDNWAFLQKIIGEDLQSPLQQVLYPEDRHYQLAVLTSFDRRRLLSMGLPEERVHLLPNPVALGKSANLDPIEARTRLCRALHLEVAKRIVTYPVRVIGRKNIGEFILLAALLQDEAHWLVTQPPLNPLEVGPYESWKSFCRDHEIAVQFEVGTRVEFDYLMQGTDFCLSTSIKEGFGMVFLEPWLMGKPVVGRNLSMVTEDFLASGIQFPLLYEQIRIADATGGQDFGHLAPTEQRTHIDRVLSQPEYRRTLLAENPWIDTLLEPVDPDIIANNRKIIADNYSLDTYGQRLHGIYMGITGQA